MMEQKEICENCGKPKHRHHEPWIDAGYFECEIVRDSGKNYRFKPRKFKKKGNPKPIDKETIKIIEKNIKIYTKEK